MAKSSKRHVSLAPKLVYLSKSLKRFIEPRVEYGIIAEAVELQSVRARFEQTSLFEPFVWILGVWDLWAALELIKVQISRNLDVLREKHQSEFSVVQNSEKGPNVKCRIILSS
jgi:hypothetical protein